MRILMLSRDASGLDASSSTATRWRLLRDRGVQLEVFIAAPVAAAWEEEGVRVQGTGGSTPWSKLWRLFVLARQRASTVDLITAQDPFELGLIAWMLARRFVKRFEIQDHGGFFDGEPAGEPLWWLRSPLARFLMRRAKAVRTVSPKSLQRLQHEHKKEGAYFLPLVSEDRFRKADYQPDPNLLVTTSRLVSVKRLDLLLDVFAELRKNRPNLRLAIVGHGPLEASLKERAHRLGVGPFVQFTGQADPLPYLQKASAFMLLSRHEGWGLAAIEAARVGVPVIMTDTGCARWLEERVHARVVPVEADTERIAAAVIDALDHPQPSKLEQGMNLEETADEQVRMWRTVSQKKPRSLVCVQAVDPADPLMGFFVGWLREFSRHSDALVCALRVSDPLPDLGEGIEIYPSRPRASHSRIRVLWNVARVSWRERHGYQSVFVRGDAQYVACLGWFWRLLGKRVVFWYAHYAARSPWFWLAALFAHRTVTSVPAANPLRSALSVGQSIDTDFFSPSPLRHSDNVPFTILILGRVSPVKRVVETVEVLRPWLKTRNARCLIVGRSLSLDMEKELHRVLHDTDIEWHNRDVSRTEAKDYYGQADVIVNATPGSLDKTILEAASSGTVVVATSPALCQELPEDLRWLHLSECSMLPDILTRLSGLSKEMRQEIGGRLRDWVMKRHSLERQVKLVAAILAVRYPSCSLRTAVKRSLRCIVSLAARPRGVAVLMFHAFDGCGPAAWTPERFVEAILLLRGHGYTLTSLADMWSPPMWRVPHKKTALITIDDGTDDVVHLVPYLKLLDVPVVLCVPSGIQTLTTSDGSVRTILPPRQINELLTTGLCEIVGHGVSHRHLTGLSDEELTEELRVSKTFVESCLRPETPLALAYPRGRFDDRVMRAAAEQGFVAGFTTLPGRWQETMPPFTIPRYPVLAWMTPVDLLRECEGSGDRLRAFVNMIGSHVSRSSPPALSVRDTPDMKKSYE